MKLTHILYVEDDPDIQFIARMALEKVGGFTLAICSSGTEALQKLKTYQPQLILLDAMMPDMDGPTTLLALRQLPQLQETPVLFMTAKVQEQEIKGFKALGAVDVITKPFDPMTLASKLNQIWESLPQ